MIFAVTGFLFLLTNERQKEKHICSKYHTNSKPFTPSLGKIIVQEMNFHPLFSRSQDVLLHISEAYLVKAGITALRQRILLILQRHSSLEREKNVPSQRLLEDGLICQKNITKYFLIKPSLQRRWKLQG